MQVEISQHCQFKNANFFLSSMSGLGIALQPSCQVLSLKDVFHFKTPDCTARVSSHMNYMYKDVVLYIVLRNDSEA